MSFNQTEPMDLTVQDLAAAEDFYSRVLGLCVQTQEDGSKALTFGGRRIDLHGSDGDGPVSSALGAMDLRFVMETPLEVVIEHLQQQGATFLQGSGDAIYLRDPDGNLVELAASMPEQGKQAA